MIGSMGLPVARSWASDPSTVIVRVSSCVVKCGGAMVKMSLVVWVVVGVAILVPIPVMNRRLIVMTKIVFFIFFSLIVYSLQYSTRGTYMRLSFGNLYKLQVFSLIIVEKSRTGTSMVFYDWVEESLKGTVVLNKP